MQNVKDMAHELLPAVRQIEADIVITFRGNPAQVAIRFTSMKEATKEFDKLHNALTKPTAKLSAVHTVKSDLMTGVLICSEITMWVLVDKLAADRAFQASMPPQRM